jgi:hypothetical protein
LKNRWGASESHPDTQTRISRVVNQAATRSPPADIVAHAAFLALRTLWPNAPGLFTQP